MLLSYRVEESSNIAGPVKTKRATNIRSLATTINSSSIAKLENFQVAIQLINKLCRAKAYDTFQPFLTWPTRPSFYRRPHRETKATE